jgi:hypothetical protein
MQHACPVNTGFQGGTANFNLQTVIYDLTADKIWVANRKDNVRASDRPYVEFSLADGWGKAAAFATAGAVPVALSKR